MTTTRPTFEGVKQAADRLQPHMTPTPLYRSETLSRALDADVWLKVETATPIASFKLRGALNHLLVAQSQAPVKSAVTSSACSAPRFMSAGSTSTTPRSGRASSAPSAAAASSTTARARG